jgi:hypothetical protein
MSSASAQIGIKGGIGISGIAFLKDEQTEYLGYEINSLEPQTPKLSFEAGIFGTIEPCKRIELQPELLYTMQGCNYSTEYLYDHITYRINISYLKMPLLVKYKIAIRKKIHSALFLGPYAAWKLKAVRATEIEEEWEKVKIPNVKNADFGLTTGYSMDFNLFSNRIIFDLRCSYGLINAINRITGYVPSYYGPSKQYARNINISLTAGYRFINICSKSAVKP